MTTLEALFALPRTWMIFGAAAQLSLTAYVRAPGSNLWMLPPGVMLACVLAAMPTAGGGSPYAYQIGMGFGVMFAGIMIAVGAPAAMNEGLLLAITTTYWISFLVAGRNAWWAGFAFLPAVLVGAVPTVAVLWIALTGLRPKEWQRFLLYLWALFALVLIGVMRFPQSDFDALQASGRGWVVVLAATYLGAHVAMLAHNALSLFALLPIPTKEQSMNERLKQVQAFAARLIAAYSPEPVGRVKAVVVVLGQGLSIWLLSLWRPEGAAVGVHASLSLILVGMIFFSRPPSRAKR